MADQPSKIRDVAWSELFPWLILLRSIRIALLARVLVLGAIGLFATWVGWRVITDAFPETTDPVVLTWSKTMLAFWERPTDISPTAAWVNTSPHSAMEIVDSAANPTLFRAPLTIWLYLTRPFVELFHPDLTVPGFVFLLICIIWELLVWGVIGGAITRIAALKFTRDEAPGPIAALKHALSKLPSYSLPPLIAMAGTALFVVQLIVMGAFMRIGVLAFLAALIWPFVFVLGLMMAVLLLGAYVGWPLMWATVSVEGTDAFDALSRSYAYTYHRPWRLLWYVVFASFLAVTSMFVVKVFASTAIALGNWSIDWGLDEQTMRGVVSPRAPHEISVTVPPVDSVPNLAATEKTSGTASVMDVAAKDAAPKAATADSAETTTAADNVIHEPTGLLAVAKSTIAFWKSIVAVLVAGYQVGFLWVAAVGIYLLLRRDIDGVQLNEVFVDQTDEYGLPALVNDPATGVPEVARNTAAVPADGQA